MIAHTGLAVRDFKAAKRFYERALAPLGYEPKMEHGESTGFNDGKNTDFWIGKAATVEPTHVAFEAKSKDEVEAFHRAASTAGGRDNGGPGYRREYWPGYYATVTTSKQSGTTTAPRTRPSQARVPAAASDA